MTNPTPRDSAQRYEPDDLDPELLVKVRDAVACLDDGAPLKDAMDPDEIDDAIRLLEKVTSHE